MRALGNKWMGIVVAVAVIVFNGLFVFRLMAPSYGRFSWEAWAQVYGPAPGTDTDMDGIPDSIDPHPLQFDPSGCFYDRFTGRIVPGGLISTTGPGNITVGLDGSNGCFQSATDAAGTLVLTIARLPPDCRLDLNCPDLGTLVVNGFTSLGFSEDPNHPGFLLGGGQCTPHYSALQFTNPGDSVITNNIPLICLHPAPVPAVSGWGWYLLILALVVVGSLGLSNRLGRRA